MSRFLSRLCGGEPAKNHGGKALTGSYKQKKWGETIRAEKLQQLTSAQAEVVCASSFTASAHFWIENRDKAASEIFGFIEEARAIRARFEQVERGTDEARALAEQYNNLTFKFGFH